LPRQAIAGGFRSASALPPRLRSQVIGSLNLFREGTAGLGEAELRMAQALADAATIGILQQRTVRRGEIVMGQLQLALNSRVPIEQAKGVLAERLQISHDDAFEVLRGAARSRNRLLSDLARVVATGSADAAQLLRRLPGSAGNLDELAASAHGCRATPPLRAGPPGHAAARLATGNPPDCFADFSGAGVFGE
jgi:hypothetical protein